MAKDGKQRLIKLIEQSDESVIVETLKTALTIRLDELEKQREEVEEQIAQTRGQLKEIAGEAPAAKPRKKRAGRKKAKKRAKKTTQRQAKGKRSGPRVVDIIRQTLRDAGGPVPLSRITEAVAKQTNRPLTNSLRSYVSQLLQRESSVKRLSRGMYAMSM